VFNGQVCPGLAAYWPHSALALQLDMQPAPQYVGPIYVLECIQWLNSFIDHTHNSHSLHSKLRLCKAFPSRNCNPLGGLKNSYGYNSRHSVPPHQDPQVTSFQITHDVRSGYLLDSYELEPFHHWADHVISIKSVSLPGDDLALVTLVRGYDTSMITHIYRMLRL
jgi:hypothetical protein